MQKYIRVCVWTIWRDIKLLIWDSFSVLFYKFAGGRSVMASLLPTKALTIGGDTRLGQSGVPALLWLPVVQGLLPFNFYFAVSACEWQPAKPRTGKTICFSLHVCTVVAICKFLDRGNGQLPILSTPALAMAAVASWCFVGSLHRSIPVRRHGSVFARKMRSTTKFVDNQFWASVLLTSVRQDVVSPSGNTCLGRIFDLWTSSLNLHF